MDPLTVFPPEIIHQIWRHLEPTDLLAARAVAPHWLASITECPGAWVTDFSHDWTEFLAVKKAVRGWSSKKIRVQTVRNVKACIFTEFAYYFLFGDGVLEMFSPNGNSVRTFHRPATDLHRGSRCLLIGVDVFVRASDPEQRDHHTIITDFALNYIDDLLNTKITASSANGYAFVQDGQTFFSLGPEIPNRRRIPYAVDARFTFLSSGVVCVHGFTVKTVQFFDAETESFSDLKTSASSPRWIPSLEIQPGPEDYFSITVEQRDFNTVSIYHRNILLYGDSYPSPPRSQQPTPVCLFTEDYCMLSLLDTITAFRLDDFTKPYNLEIPEHFDVKYIKCEPWSLVNNSIVVFTYDKTVSDSTRWLVYRLLPTSCKSPTSDKSINEDLKFKPKLQLLGDNSTNELPINGGLDISNFEVCPGYAFNIKFSVSHTNGYERVVHLLHFDI